MKELKMLYNKIIKQQDKAMEWFGSDDFKTRFEKEGQDLVNKSAFKYRQYDKKRIEILNKLEKNGVNVSINEIIYGFKEV